MSDSNSVQQQTFEQFADMWDDLAGWSANFASGVVEAFEKGGASAYERLMAVRQNYQVAIAGAIARRELALAAADVIAEGVWRQAADEMSRISFLLADETKDAATRLATFQDAVNDGLRNIGRFVGPAFDIYAVGDAIRNGDGNKAGEAVLSIGLGAVLGVVFTGSAGLAGAGAAGVSFFGGVGAVFGAVGAKYLNPYTTRPFFDWMGSYLPDGFWQALESLTFGSGAARLDPSGAVYTSMLLHRIDNSIQLDDLGRLFDLASSAREGRETIALLNDLNQVFLPARPSLSDDATDEQLIAYAGRIAAVTDAFAGGLRIKAAVPTASDARLDFGAFLSLQNLSPFVVSGTDPQAQASLNALWQNTHGDVYLDWASDRQAVLRGDDQHEMAFSDRWVADRIAMLNALLDTHVRDLSATDTLMPNPGSGLLAAQYLDLASDTRIQVGLDLMTTPRVIFGTAGNDAAGDLSGGQGSDHLYGGAGDDGLVGHSGADHLEGGTGADTLDGGAGNDRLLGGSGLDTYLLDGSAGSDMLIDEDGGVIRYQDRILTGGQESAPGSGEWQDGAARYHLVSDGERQHLLISAGAGTVLVQDWRPGHLGIQLQDAPAAPPAPSADLVLHGDRAPLDHDATTDGVQSRTDALGNLIVKPDQIEADRADYLYDSTGNDQLFGHGGDDSLNAQRGDDFLDGGAGKDALRAGAGRDRLIGGGGLDRLFGQDDSDRLYADLEQSDAQVIADHDPDTEDTQGIAEPGELLIGGNGDDWQVGHRRADVLLGGLGRDQLWGGAGDDVLYGDLDASTAWSGWRVQRVVQTPQSDLHPTYVVYSWEINHLDVDTSIAGGDDDLRGGAGNDWLFGEGGQDRLDGGSGFDVLFGGTGSDWLEGGDGNDHLIGDEGANSSDGHDHDYLNGGAGDDDLWGDAGHDQLFGGDGDDWLLGDNIRSQGALHGNDFLEGGAGDDALWGHGGGDQLLGGTGADLLWGDDGPSKAIDAPFHGQDLLMGEAGGDVLVGGGDADTLLGGEDDDWLYGDDLTDMPETYTIAASAHGDDWLDGGAGNDVLYGGGGADQLLGGDGHDDLFGGEGHDTLDGGKGWNRLEGGSGDDLYIARGADLLSPALADVQFFDVSTTISDSQGHNTIRVDALQRDITLLPMDNSDGSTGLCLVWPMGLDAQARPRQAALGLGSMREVSHFTIEFADGQRVALARWMGDSLQAPMIASGTAPSEWLAGAAGNDRLSLYGQGSQVMGGRGNDTIELHADASVVHFDRGDGHDVLSGRTSGHRIAFGTGIAPEDLSLTVTPEGKAVISVAGLGDETDADSIELPTSLADLADSDFIADIAFADGTVWTMAQVVSLLPRPPQMPESPLISTGPAVTVYVGPQQLAVAAVPGLPDLTPWDDDLGPDAHEPSGLQEQRWLQDLMYRQYEQAFERSWGIETPLSQETAPLTSQTSGAALPGTADATFDAQVNSLIQAMAAFAPPPMASFAPSSDQQTSALAPVLAAGPF